MDFTLVEDKEYTVEYKLLASRDMKRVFFLLGEKGKTQRLNMEIKKDAWSENTIKFVSEVDGVDTLCITATNLPIVSDFIRIEYIRIN